MCQRFRDHRALLTRTASFLLLSLTGLCLPSAAEAQVQLGQHVNYTNITGQTTTAIKPAPGVLHVICINTIAVSEVITLWDSLSASGTKIGTITTPATVTAILPGCLTYNVSFNIGLTVQTATASSDITVTWE